MIAFHSIFPDIINEKIKEFRGPTCEFKWADINFKSVSLTFVSTKDNACHGVCHYFKMNDKSLFHSYDKIIQKSYSPIWKTETQDYLLRVSPKHVNGVKLRRQQNYKANIQLVRYCDCRVHIGKGRCYRAILTDMKDIKNDNDNCGFID